MTTEPNTLIEIDFEIKENDYLAFQKQFVLKAVVANKRFKLFKFGYPILLAYIYYTILPENFYNQIILGVLFLAGTLLWLKYF